MHRGQGGTTTTTTRDEAVDLQAVIEAQNVINATDRSFVDVMQMVVDRTQMLTGASGAVLELAEGDEMIYRAVSGSASGSIGLRVDRNGSLSGLCVSTGRVMYCQDTEADGRVDLEACREAGARSMVVAPLVHRGRTVGVLKVLSSRPEGFGPRDVEAVELTAGFIAASLAHAGRFDELVRLNEALDSFTGHVAHDLHNPLAVVGMAAASLRKLLGDSFPEASDLVWVIEQQAEHSAELVSGLLALARAGRTPRRCAFDLGEVVDEAAGGIDGLELENLCRGVTVVADWMAVRQAVANLLSNAARHGAGEGIAVVAVGCEEQRGGWRVSVSDRGPGLAGNDVRRVFSAFERGSEPAAAEGSGLGLAIVAAMARAHGGEAGYEPRPEGGSTFWFTLLRDDRH